MTNADKVRGMTNEELAWIIECPYSRTQELCSVADADDDDDEPGCLECCRKWLESDAGDE